ncbi:hypothetical protein [Acidovorax sp. sic0104]|uniref:hypothetical protein n=1 Tax=Acidovorax sp. sic0104 TaxID=2854784 RepID=UPI001C45B0DC|nr:hypothetical protein [Acidovorax sp. sic0104]MBV7541962.1 hypothetical protein [Acidovorax sp. sic0104]
MTFERGDLVEYQTGHGEYATGRVTVVNHADETVEVEDEDDGSTWSGLMDYATLLEKGRSPAGEYGLTGS